MSDTTKPVLLGLTLPSVIDLGAGSTSFSVGVHAQDEPGGSGVRWVTVYFKAPAMVDNYGFPVSNGMLRYDDHVDSDNFHDATPTSASQTVSVSNLTQSGTYEIEWVIVVDAAGNENIYDTARLQALGLRTSMTVTNGIEDTEAPVLVSLKLPSRIDLNSSLSERVQVEAFARDKGGAGVETVTITFDKPLNSGQGPSFGPFGPSIDLRLTSGTRVVDAIDAQSWEVSGRHAPGVYNIANVRVSDYLDNVRDYSAVQLQAMGIETAMTITGNPGQNPPPPPMANLSWEMAEQGLVLTVTPDGWSTAPGNGFVLHVERKPGAGSPLGVSLTGGATGELTVHEYGSMIMIRGDKLAGVGPGTGIALTMGGSSAGALPFKFSGLNINGSLYGITGEQPAVDYYRGSDASERIDHEILPEFVDGRGGLDILRVHGQRSSYRIEKSGDGFALVSVDGSGTRLANVERIAFDNGRVALDTDGAAGQLYRLYQAAFDRAPDPTGFGHWLGRMEAGDSLEQIAGYFVASREFIDLTGVATSDRDFVTALYDNVLHRQPDATGLDFWVGVLGRGALDRTEVLVEFSESPENVAQLVGAIQHGIDYTLP